MLNHAETINPGTIISVEPAPHLAILATLLAHPDFQAGVREGQEFFEESYEPAPLTEEEMIEEVEMNLSQRVIERSYAVCQYHGWDPYSYLHNLGVVIGIIGTGLSYAQ